MDRQPFLFRPAHLLQAEAFCFLCACCAAFHLLLPHRWPLFACLFLLPDLSLLAYLRQPSAGASMLYNTMHSYVLPSLLGALAALLHGGLLVGVSLVWLAHISVDRVLGYGLKYPFSFRFTHIQSAANPVSLPGRSDTKA